jgi:diaminohydroxyphosphoribosylaminopyrimidine deaminase/5-amino-6-(5-phosphoribosylamino)uracil reductase
MHRAIELAYKAAGYTAPNPMVGAVLVYNDRIIGEGYHQLYGQPHAEVNCIRAVSDENREFISRATMYVTLEPCTHFGKTPPCADLIIKHKIHRVVIGVRDPFTQVDGKGIEKLKAAGVEVKLGIMEKECRELNKRFFEFHTGKRPYIILKWAQTANGMIGTPHARLHITNDLSNRLVHKWRSEEMSILVGTNTAASDDPALTNRLYAGPQPVRMVVDLDLRVPASNKLFDGSVKTIVFNSSKAEEQPNLLFYKVDKNSDFIQQMPDILYEMGIQSILVEGGSRLLQSFIDAGIWDEARVITNEIFFIEEGIAGPRLHHALLNREEHLLNDRIDYFSRTKDQPASS